MSRIGKRPIDIPSGVEVKIDGNKVTVKGPLGTQEIEVRPELSVKLEDNKLFVEVVSKDPKASALWGLTRTLINNMVVGVKDAFTKTLEINGVGYRAAKEGNTLVLSLGYSHPVKLDPPEGIEVQLEGNNKVIVKGANKQAVGDFASLIRSKRPPEVYKGKGIKYAGEYIRRKAGKAGK